MEGVERCVKGVDQVQYRKVVDDHPLVQIVRVPPLCFGPATLVLPSIFPHSHIMLFPMGILLAVS
jgi:hypothetical protein